MQIETRTHGLRLSKMVLGRLEQHIHSALAPWSLRASSVQLFLTGTNDLPGDERVGRLVVRLPRVGDIVVADRHERLLPLLKRLGRLAAAVIHRRLGRRRTLRRRLSHHRETMTVA